MNGTYLIYWLVMTNIDQWLTFLLYILDNIIGVVIQWVPQYNFTWSHKHMPGKLIKLYHEPSFITDQSWNPNIHLFYTLPFVKKFDFWNNSHFSNCSSVSLFERTTWFIQRTINFCSLLALFISKPIFFLKFYFLFFQFIALILFL